MTSKTRSPKLTIWDDGTGDEGEDGGLEEEIEEVGDGMGEFGDEGEGEL